ncbi:MAG: DUF6323 family protein [bacterium]|nr:DUF6323 family protein [bacterium]
MKDIDLFSLITGNNANQLEKVEACNQYTKKFGLELSKEQALQLLNDRKDSLKEQARVEFGEGILPKLIYAFCDSPYIYEDNYVEVMGYLQDIFYLYKNEALDEVTDDELIEYMRDEFNGECQGSVEYLEDTSLEKFAREIRVGTRRFMGLYRNKEDEE